ncbi:Protein C2-DOMAIN ABA-RELATED 4 [Zea mays]|uniref:Protein C2-DOMAIN ABA-RELATED 4 n=1 Tax=Zea mays TaxID=4577 RepID=A0A1D6HRJ3_MAIZE|nr:Protein C2-DOMAIN ABA-RELATED 4 [Zea mays]
MGGGNAQKSKMARERNAEKNKGGKGSQLEANKKAMNIQVSSSSCLPCVPVEILGVFPDSLGFQATPSGFGRSSHGAILEP